MYNGMAIRANRNPIVNVIAQFGVIAPLFDVVCVQEIVRAAFYASPIITVKNRFAPVAILPCAAFVGLCLGFIFSTSKPFANLPAVFVIVTIFGFEWFAASLAGVYFRGVPFARAFIRACLSIVFVMRASFAARFDPAPRHGGNERTWQAQNSVTRGVKSVFAV